MLLEIAAAVGVAVALLLVWIVLLEAPRVVSLLAEIKKQQHAHIFTPTADGAGEEMDAASATAHAESLQFRMQPLTLTVPYTDCEGHWHDAVTGTAEVLSIVEPDAPANRPLFLLVPGNPGLVLFSKLFLLYLHRLTAGRVELRVVSYVGHTSVSRNGGRPFPFRAQLAFFSEVLRRAMEEEGKEERQVFLAGHSVGAYVVLHMLDSLPAEQRARVAQAFMLMPTIMNIADTPNGFTHVPLLRWCRPLLSGFMGAVATCLPRSLQRYILAHAVGLNAPYEVAAAEALLQSPPHAVAACLAMAAEEMQQIGPLDLQRFVQPYLQQLYFVWGQNDRWAPVQQLEQLRAHFGSRLRVELAHEDAAHAFVVGGAHLVAPLVARQMEPFLGAARTSAAVGKQRSRR